MRFTAQKTGICIADILAAAYVGPRESELVRLRRGILEGDAGPETWERASVILSELAQPQAAGMFAAVAVSMRAEGKRYTLTYPNGFEYIEEVMGE